MTSFPRREKPASKVGPRIDIAPDQISALLQDAHGLSNLLLNHDGWESFCWKGNDLSAPLRGLWAAESLGLYPGNGQRAIRISVANITANINAYLAELGKSPVSENSVYNNLRNAATYLQTAVGVSFTLNRQTQEICFTDQIENEANIEKYCEQLSSKLKKLAVEVNHAEACGYKVDHLLIASQEQTGLRILPGRTAVSA